MSSVIKFKRDPVWLNSLPSKSSSVIFLQGGFSKVMIQIPASLLVASSPLVRNILSDCPVPPPFSTPVISFPSVSAVILKSVQEMLVSGIAMMENNKICGVIEFFRMIGMEHWIINKIEKQEDVENAKIEIAIELESDPMVEEFVFQTNQPAAQPSQSCLKKGESNEEPTSKRKLRTNMSTLKQPVDTARLRFDKKIKLKHNKVKEQCPYCDKALEHYTLKKHIKYAHMKSTVTCSQCDKEISGWSIYHHIRAVHNKEKKQTEQCPYCDKALEHYTLKRHIKYTHMKSTIKCSQCDKEIPGWSIYRHIRTVHNKEKKQ